MTQLVHGRLPWVALLIVVLMQETGMAVDRPAREIPQAATARERFLKLIERTRSPLEAAEQPPVSGAGVVEQRFSYLSEPDQRVPGLIVKPESAKVGSPAVIVLHGTGGSKDSIPIRQLLGRIAGQGMIAVAIDARYSGERIGYGKGTDSYRAAIFRTWQTGQGFPFYYDTTWDALRLIDYLETRSDIDPKRIAGLGLSKGGTELYLAAAVDSRLAAIVPCIGVQSFGWAVDHNAWSSRISTIQSAVESAARESGVETIDNQFIRKFYDRVVPGIRGEFDGQAMLPLIAPRPLLVINGDRDDRTPRPGLELCIEATRSAYEKAGAGKNFEFILQTNTGHAVTPQSEAYAVDWLKRQLSR